MKSTIIKIDSTQFSIIQSKIDSAIKLAGDTGNTYISSPNIFNNVGHNNPSIWLLILEYLIAPSIIIFISVWLTNYSNKSKEYNRIKKLSDFVTTWLNKIEEGISEQINLLKALQNTYKNIDFNSQRDFSYSVADIKSVIELPQTDLHKLFISIRTGSEIEKNENFYNLLLALNSAYESIYDYKLKTPELAKNVNEISDEGADAFKHLRVGEASYVNYHLQKAQQNPIYITSPAFQIATEYSSIAQARHTYLATPIGNTRIKKGLYSYCKKQLAFCENNLPSDQNLLPLIELNRLVKESIVYYTEYYKNIRNALETKINGLGRIKLEITERKNYFVNLPFISKSSFRE